MLTAAIMPSVVATLAVASTAVTATAAMVLLLAA